MDILIVRARGYARREVEVVLRFRQPQDVEDVLQRVCEVVWTRLHTLRARRRATFRAWVRRIARNKAIDHLRPIREEPQQFSFDLEDDTGRGHPEKELARMEQRELILEAVARLPERQQEVLLLRVVDGMSYAAIGRVLDISINTVGPTLRAARQNLARILQPHGLER